MAGMRRCRIALAAFAAAAAAITVSAAGAGAPREPHETWRGGSGFLADSVGRVYGDEAHGCAWYGGPLGGSVIRFPPRYSVHFHPLRIVAGFARVVAVEGDWIRTVGGGSSSRVAGCPKASGYRYPTTIEFWGRTRPKLR
jgi:hypothetical protein